MERNFEIMLIVAPQKVHLFTKIMKMENWKNKNFIDATRSPALRSTSISPRPVLINFPQKLTQFKPIKIPQLGYGAVCVRKIYWSLCEIANFTSPFVLEFDEHYYRKDIPMLLLLINNK